MEEHIDRAIFHLKEAIFSLENTKGSSQFYRLNNAEQRIKLASAAIRQIGLDIKKAA